MIENLNKLEFSKSPKFRKQKDDAIKSGQEWIKSRDVDKYIEQLNSILKDEPYSAIADQIQSIKNDLEKIQ